MHKERGDSYKMYWTGEILLIKFQETTHVSVDFRVNYEYLFKFQTAIQVKILFVLYECALFNNVIDDM